jgi:hypothetical protein
MVASNMKPAAQCARAAKTAMTVLGQISRAFTYREKKFSQHFINVMSDHTFGAHGSKRTLRCLRKFR